MIKKYSDDPDVAHAAGQALEIIQKTLAELPKAETFDYGGHNLKLGEYDVCTRCTSPIAEAQAAERALLARAQTIGDETVREHLEVAAQLFHAEAEAATIRAELHNGHNTEAILNVLLGHEYARQINDDYQHSHHGGNS
jgi:hypothetical protein